MVFPGLANTHSHAFHRALRGRTNARGSFWTWREEMYRIANLLDPETYLELATATYAEMVMAGFTAVGEFHYLHHQPDGTPYSDPNHMGEVLREAAKRAGIRLTLLGHVLSQRRDRPAACGPSSFDSVMRMPIAGPSGCRPCQTMTTRESDPPSIRSGRCQKRRCRRSRRLRPLDRFMFICPNNSRRMASAWRSTGSPRPNSCDATEYWGLAPLRCMPPTSSRPDIALLASSSTGVCLCPTTERDLGDGIDSGFALDQAGVPISLGTDQHVAIDAFEEMRGSR